MPLGTGSGSGENGLGSSSSTTTPRVTRAGFASAPGAVPVDEDADGLSLQPDTNATARTAVTAKIESVRERRANMGDGVPNPRPTSEIRRFDGSSFGLPRTERAAAHTDKRTPRAGSPVAFSTAST